MSFGAVAAIAGPVIGGLLGSDAAGDATAAQSQSAARTDATNRYVFDKQVELQAPFREAGLSANNQLMYLLGLSPSASGAGAAQPQQTYEQLRKELEGQYTKQGAYGMEFEPRRGAIMPFTRRGASTIDEAGLGAEIQRRLAAQAQPGQRQADPNDPAFGSLMRDFSLADFEKDPGYQFRMDEGSRAIEGGAAARGGLLSGAAQKALLKYGQNFASNEFGNAFSRDSANKTNKFNRLKSMIDTGTGASTQIGNAAQTFGSATAQTNAAVGNAQAAGAIGQANAWSNSVGQVSNNLMQLIQKPGSSGSFAANPYGDFSKEYWY